MYLAGSELSLDYQIPTILDMSMQKTSPPWFHWGDHQIMVTTEVNLKKGSHILPEK